MDKYPRIGDSNNFGKKAKFAFVCIGIIGIILSFGAVSYYLCTVYFDTDDSFISEYEESDNTSNTSIEAAPGKIIMLEQQAASFAFDEDQNIKIGVISSGETAANLLNDILGPTEMQNMVQACKSVYALNKLRAGQPYAIIKENGSFSRFEYEIDRSNKLVVCRLPSAFTATIERIEYNIELVKVEGTIDSSLFESMSDVGETPVLAVMLSNIFAWEINFVKNIKQGDSFVALVEKRYRDGEFKGYGNLLVAEFVNAGKKFKGYQYTSSFGTEYFTTEGESMKRQFLKAPLSFSRISSRFTTRRLHPIHKVWKSHPAVDYAAPAGTPIKSIANGRVKFVGRGKGEGNYIVLSHSSGLESMYLHLSRFASGLKKGNTVTQGQVIGYVGSTGYSTGPHLDFRIKKNGNYVNPETTLTPRSESLSKASLQDFKKQRDKYNKLLVDENARKEYGKEGRDNE